MIGRPSGPGTPTARSRRSPARTRPRATPRTPSSPGGEADGEQPEDEKPDAEQPEEEQADAEQPEEEKPDGEQREGDAEGEKPEYTVYGKGGEERRQVAPKRAEEPEAAAEPGDKPDYKVYKSRPSLRDRLRKPDLAGLRQQRRSGGLRDRLGKGEGEKRRWLRWVLIGVCGWILLSFVAFAVSAQIQKGKLSDEAKDALSPGPTRARRLQHPHPRRRPAHRCHGAQRARQRGRRARRARTRSWSCTHR